MNGRDFPVPSTPRAQRVAVYGNSVPRWRDQTFHQLVLRGKPMSIVAVGIDLAKNVFAVHGVGASGKPELVKPDVKRNKLLELIASLPPCLIGMDA
jgi:transposase